MAQNSEDAPTPAKEPMIIANTASASTQEPVNREELVRMFCIDLRPCDILKDLEDRSFLELMRNIINYSLPSKEKFTEELIPEVFNRARSDLMKTLKSVPHVAISIETWQSGEINESNMFTATAHFVHQAKFVSQTLFTKEIREWTKENIGNAIRDGFIEWRVLEKVVSLTTNGDRNGKLLKEVAEDLLKIPHLYCVADLLRSRILASMNHLDFKELEMKCQNDNSDLVLKTKKDEPFCWHDQYILLKHISEHNAGNFTADERKAYSECFQILKFIEFFNNKLSSEPYIPLSRIIPLYVGLELRIRTFTPCFSLARSLKEKLECVLNIHHSHTFWFTLKATFFDPRYKTEFLKKYFSGFEDLLQKLETELDECINGEPEESVFIVHWTGKVEHLANTSSRTKAMMSHYVNVPELHPGENPFQFWEDFSRTHEYGEFHRLAQKYLCIPANAKPIETISGEYPWNKFVRNKIAYNERRRSLDCENIDKILFLHSYYSKNEFITNKT